MIHHLLYFFREQKYWLLTILVGILGCGGLYGCSMILVWGAIPLSVPDAYTGYKPSSSHTTSVCNGIRSNVIAYDYETELPLIEVQDYYQSEMVNYCVDDWSWTEVKAHDGRAYLATSCALNQSEAFLFSRQFFYVSLYPIYDTRTIVHQHQNIVTRGKGDEYKPKVCGE